MGLRYQIFGASSPIAKHRVRLRPIVLEYQYSRQISPIRRDHMSFFLRKCSPTRKRSLASSLLLPFGRHTPSAAPEPCALAGTCSFLRGRRSTNPRKCRRSEFLLACPNYGTVLPQNVKIFSSCCAASILAFSSSPVRQDLHRVRRSRIYFFACARNFAHRAL